MGRVIYITYKEAQRLTPFFKYSKKNAPYKEARESSSRILKELENVRDIDYSPLSGYQMFLKEDDWEFLMDVFGTLGEE